MGSGIAIRLKSFELNPRICDFGASVWSLILGQSERNNKAKYKDPDGSQKFINFSGRDVGQWFEVSNEVEDRANTARLRKECSGG